MCFNVNISIKFDKLTKRIEELANEVKDKSKEEQIKAFEELMDNYIEKNTVIDFEYEKRTTNKDLE